MRIKIVSSVWSPEANLWINLLDGEDHLQFLWGNGCVSFAQSSSKGGRISGFVTQKTITINTSKTATVWVWHDDESVLAS